MSSIIDRWWRLREEVAEAAERYQRQPDSITIIGVSKYADMSQTAELIRAGCRDLGESRPQSLWEKAEAMGTDGVRWHLIGHLQRNKSRRILPWVHCIHSIDSMRLVEQIEVDAAKLKAPVSVMLEVNLTADIGKTGMTREELWPVATRCCELSHVKVLGLMGMAGNDNPFPGHDFAAIRRLRDELQQDLGEKLRLEQLSMGMSGDFVEAIAEGATMIRIGSRLFADHD